MPNLWEDSSGQKLISRQTSQENIYGRIGKDLSNDLAKGLDKTFDILLKPEHVNEQMPYDLSQAAQRRKKKRKSQRLK